MALQIKDKESDVHQIELEDNGYCVDVRIDDRVVARFRSNGTAEVWDENDDAAWKGKWKK